MLPIPFLSAGTALPTLPGVAPAVAPSAIDFAALLPTGVAPITLRHGDAEAGKPLPANTPEQHEPAGTAATWITPPLWHAIAPPIVPPAAEGQGAAAAIVTTSPALPAPLASTPMPPSPGATQALVLEAPASQAIQQAVHTTPDRLPTPERQSPIASAAEVATAAASRSDVRHVPAHPAVVATPATPSLAKPTAVTAAGTKTTFADDVEALPSGTMPVLEIDTRAAAPLAASTTGAGLIGHPDVVPATPDTVPPRRFVAPASATRAPAISDAATAGPDTGPVTRRSLSAASLDQKSVTLLASTTPATTATVHLGEGQTSVAPEPLPARDLAQTSDLSLAARASTAGPSHLVEGQGRAAPSPLPARGLARTSEPPSAARSATVARSHAAEGQPQVTLGLSAVGAGVQGTDLPSPVPATADATNSLEEQRTTATPGLGLDYGLDQQIRTPLTSAAITVESRSSVAGVTLPTQQLGQASVMSPAIVASAIDANSRNGTTPATSIAGTMPPPVSPVEAELPAAATAPSDDTPTASLLPGEGRGPVATGPMLDPGLRRGGGDIDTPVAAPSTPQPEAALRPTTKDQPKPAVVSAPAPQQPAQPTRIAPAAQVFAAAIHQAVRDERRPDAPDPALAAIAPTTDVAAHAVTAADNTRPAALDMARDTWPAKMIERIEMIRDALDAVDTSIRLVPDKLGTIDVSLRRDGDTVQVHFTAQQAETRQLLADAQPKLAELADAKGLKLSAQTGDGTGGQPQQQQRAPSTAPQSTTRPNRAASNDDAAALADERIA